MIKEPAVTGEIYHIYNRGVEKRTVFEDNLDRIRFVHCLFEFNDSALTQNLIRMIVGGKSEVIAGEKAKPRDKLVDIVAWCLMPNHYHLLLRQKVDGGITTFMRKLGTGYTNAFNLKKERVGPLFQGTFKMKNVSKNSHLLYLPHYIHLNPVDILLNEGTIQHGSPAEVIMGKLMDYRWSSLQDYCGKNNFPSVIDTGFPKEMFGEPAAYKKEITTWLKEGSDSVFGKTLFD